MTTNSTQQAIQISANQNTDVTVTAGQSVAISGDAAVQSMVVGDGGALVIHFSNGATVTIANFMQAGSFQPPATITLPGGTPVALSSLEFTTLAPTAQTAAADQTPVAKPATGEDAVLKLDPGTEYKFGFALDEAQTVRNNGGQLVISFKEGGQLIIPNYGTDGGGAKLVFAGGEVLTHVPFTQASSSTAQQSGTEMASVAEQLSGIEPAAGEGSSGGSASGGFGFQSTFNAAPLESIGKIGPIDPTALGYQAPDRGLGPVAPDEAPAPIAVDVSAVSKWVKEDGSVVLALSAAPAESTHQITLTVTGFLSGWQVDTAASGGTYDPATGTWTITLLPGASFTSGPTVFPPANQDTDMTGLKITADVTDTATGRTASDSAIFDVFTDAVADKPNLTAANATGTEDTLIPLTIVTSPSDTDGSEAITKVFIYGIPADASLNKGTRLAGGEYELSPADLAGLALTPAPNWSGVLNLVVKSIVNEVNLGGAENDLSDNQAEASAELFVTVNPDADVPVITAKDAQVKEDGSVALSVDAALTDLDGSETLTVSISGIQPGWGVSLMGIGDSYNAATGTWSVTLPAGVTSFSGGPTVSPPANSDADLTGLTATATATETGNGDTASASAALKVVTDAVVDAVTIAAADATGLEDTVIPLTISIGNSTDTDASESTGSVFISGVPAGFTLNNGVKQLNGDWELSRGDLAGLSIAAPKDFNGTLNLTASITNTESSLSGGEYYFPDNTLTVIDAFTVTFTPSPDTPALRVADAQVKEDGSIGVKIEADLSGPATDYLVVSLSGIQPGWGVDVAGAGGVYDALTGTWSITLAAGQNFSGILVFSPPANTDADLTGLAASAVEHDPLAGQTSGVNATVNILTDAVVDPITVDAQDATGAEDTAIPLVIDIGASLDIDGSESVTAILITGVPADASLNNGVKQPGGAWLLTEADLAGLTITPAAHWSGTIGLTVAVTNTETTLSGTEWDTADNTLTVSDNLTVTVTPDADAPKISAVNKWVKEDGSVALQVNANLVDTDGSETLTVSVSGIQPGWGVSLMGIGDTYNAATGTWTISLPAGVTSFSGGPTLSPPANSDADLTGLTATATATETGNGDTASASAGFSVFTDAVVDPVTLTAADASGAEGHAVPLSISLGLSADTDGSESVTSIRISGVPADATLNHGVKQPGGDWLLARADLSGLELTPAAHFNGTITLTVRATETETNLSGLENDFTDNSDTVTAMLDVMIGNTINKPVVSATDVWVKEDGSVALKVSANLVDPSAADVLTVSVSGILPGWSVNTAGSGGVYSAATGTWTITLPAGVTSFSGGPTVFPPANSDADMTGLTVTATATDGEISAAATASENVFTDAVIDGPSLSASNAGGSDNGPIALTVGLDRGGDNADGSESVTSILISGVPAGATLNHGVKQPGGDWLLAEGDLAGLALTPVRGFEGVISLTVRATETETNLSGLENDFSDNSATATAALTVTVNDDEPIFLAAPPAAVDESNLAAGNLAASGNVMVNVFSDTPAAITATGAGSFGASGSLKGGSLASNGVPVTVTLSGNTYTGKAGAVEVFTLTVQPGGSYSFTQKAPLDHANAANANDVISLSFGVTVTDADGDTATGSVVVNVFDDAPLAHDDVNVFKTADGGASGNVVTGLNGGAGAADALSADASNTVTKVTFNGVDTLLAGGSATVIGTYGTLQVFADGGYTYALKPDVAAHKGAVTTITDTFGYTLTDGDGDFSAATLQLTSQPPVFIVGKNVDDASGSGTAYEVGTGTGTVTGGAAPDLLVGDTGGARAETQIKDYNIVLVLDVSGSMQGDKLALLKSAVNNLIDSFSDYAGGAVKVHIIPFASGAQTGQTFTVNDGGAGFAAAQGFVTGLVADGFTNYEGPMQSAINWLKSTTGNAPIAGADTYTYFVSDGAPNRYVNGTNQQAGTDTNAAAENRAMYEIQGLGSNGTGTESDSNDNDGSKSEVAALKALSTDVISVGIGVNAATLARLDIIDKDGDALDVQDAADLAAALQGASPLNRLSDAGSDVIVSGADNDLVFGDVLYTDALALANGLSTRPGAGWEVFAALESSHGWTRADTIAYIKANAEALSAETQDSEGNPRAGGHDMIDGGIGNDVIFGQEGNDLITGGAGDDLLSGGTGADTFFLNAPGQGIDEIIGFSAAEGDVLNIQNILSGFDPEGDDIHNFVQTLSSGGDTIVRVDITGSGAAYQTVAVLEGVNIDVDTLVGNGNLVA